MESDGDTARVALDSRRDWSEFAVWAGDGLRREVLFLRSEAAGADLFASVYAGASPARFGVVICNAWGFEGNRAGGFAHQTSIGVARGGGVGVVFHYPGFGDSGGDFDQATPEVLAAAAADVAREASRRHPEARWTLAGLRLGAAVAALATDRGAAVDDLLLVQPALRPTAYFAKLERISKRSIGDAVPAPAEGFAFGYPLPPAVLASAAAADQAVERALSAFPGTGAVVRYERPAKVEGLPDRFEQVVVPGVWRIGAMSNRPLVKASVQRLQQHAEVPA
jgi:hypothetical protein